MAKKIFNYVKNAREAQKQAAPVVFVAVVVGLIMLACSGCSATRIEWTEGWHSMETIPAWFQELSEEEVKALVARAWANDNYNETIDDRQIYIPYDIAWRYNEFDDTKSIICIYKKSSKYKHIGYQIIISRRWLEERPLE